MRSTEICLLTFLSIGKNVDTLSRKQTGKKSVEVVLNTKGLAIFLKGSPVLTAIRKFSCNFTPHSYRTLSHLKQEIGTELVEPEYNRSL